MDDLLDDDDLEFENLDESDHSFKRKRPTEASWDSDDELLQEDHIPVKKTKTLLSDDDLDEDALLGDSDNEDFSSYKSTAEHQGPGELVEDSALVEAANVETNDESYEYGLDDQAAEQTNFVGGEGGDYDEQLDDQIAEYQGEDDDQLVDQTGGETGEISMENSGMLDNTESEEWGAGDGEADVGGDYGGEEGEGEYQEEGDDNFEEGYNEDAVAEDEEEVATEDEDTAILEDAIELEPGMDDILDIEDFDDSLIEDVPEDNTMSGRTAKLASSTPKAPVREKPAQAEVASKPKEQPLSQPAHSEEKEEEEGSDTKEDIPSSDSDEDDDDDNTRARFKSERRPVTVKVGGASKRKDIPETLEITAQVQQTLDDYARQNQEQQWTKRNRGRGGRGFRGNRGNRGNRHQGPPPPMMGMHPGNMGPRFPGHMGPRFPGDMRHRFPGDVPHHFHDNVPHFMGDMPPRPAFQHQEVIRGPPAGHLRGGRFDFEPYHPVKGSPNRVPHVQQGSGQEPSGLNQGGQRSSSPLTQAPQAQQSSQPGAVTTSQPQSSVSKKIHINPHFKGQVQVPSQQVVTPQTAHPPAHSTAPTHSQYQPPSTASSQYQPTDSYPNQYPTQPYSQHGTAQGHPSQPMQTQPSSHSQGPRPLMEQQHPASYRDPNHHHGDQQSGQWMPPSSQHPSSGAWTQPGRRSPVSVTWSHQQGPPRREFQGHQPHQHPPQFNRAQTPEERIPPHQQFQSPRGMQPNQMRPHSEPQHQGGPQPHQQGPSYHGQGPQSARQGSGQRFPTPNNQQPGQFTSQQQRPQGSGIQPSAPNQANKGKILPSPKRLIEEASKKAPKVPAAKQVKGEIDEDAETRKLRIQLEEQKKLREMILQRKEARRQQLAASKQAELKKRLLAKKPKSSAESSDTQRTNREQQPPAQQQQQQQQQRQQQQQQPIPSQGARMPGPRHSATTQQPPNHAGNRTIPPASINRNNSAQAQQNLPRQVSQQQWAGGPGQSRPMSQPRAQMVRHEVSPLGKQGPPGQLFQQQTWQQQQNVKVLVDNAPQPIPTVGAGGRVQPQQPIGVVGLANRAPSGQVGGQQQDQNRGQHPGQIRGQHPGQFRGQQPSQIRGQQPGQIRGQQPGQIRSQQPGQIRGQQPGQIRGQQPGQIRGQQPGQIRSQQPGQIRSQQPGQIRGQHPGQIRGQHPGQIRGQQPNKIRGQHPGQIRGQHPSQVRGHPPQGPLNNMGRGRGRGQPQQRFPMPRLGQPQGNGPRPQGPRPHGRGGPQFRGPRPQGMAPRLQGPGTPQGGPRPQKRSVKDRIGIPQHGPGQPQQAPEQVQRRVVQQQSPQQAQKATTNQGAGNQPSQPGSNRTVVQNMTPQQRLLQQKQQQRLAGRPQGANQPVRVLPPQPQRVVKQVSAESPQQVVRGPLGILIDGLSASTNKKNLMKMLQSCGPIKNMEIVASERRAYAKFCRPEDAMAFQTKFHRHMIDLATINVSLIQD